ncbi:hypothetical protein [Dongia sp.]|uniref:hypothetical protein n=1 Tax=Dongia sp. TaxID=1977262 RepID=UPI003751E97E
MSFDDVLVAEMPKLNRIKLESSGWSLGLAIGLLLLLLLACLDYYGSALLVGTFAMDVIWPRFIGHLLLFFAVLNLHILPSLLKRWAVRREVTFRRRHGKWRWER